MKLIYEQTVNLGHERRYVLTFTDEELITAELDNWDRLLLDDIEHGPRSKHPIADYLLGLETIARRIEQHAAGSPALHRWQETR